MAKVYTEEELNNFSRETLMAVILSMQDQIHQLNTNMERLIEQIADANNKRYGRSSEKLETISGQLELELIFNEAEALTETLYVVEPVEEDVIQPRRKNKGKREADLKDLPIEVIVHTLSEEKLQDVFGTDGWKQLPDEIYKRVRVQPAVYTVEEHHVAVYAGKDNQTTGHYWFAFAKYVNDHQKRLVMVNPFSVKKIKELDDNSPKKTDSKDPKTIAKLVVDGRYSIPYMPEGIYAEIRDLVYSREPIWII